MKRMNWVALSILINLVLFCWRPNAAFGQAAGPGSENPENLPGQPIKLSGPPPPGPAPITDPQVKAILAQMQAAGVLHPVTVDQWRRAYLFYAKYAGPPEKIFRVQDLKIPGPAAEIPIRIYAPRAGDGLPVWVFFHGGSFVAGSLDTHDATLRAIANRCDCLIVSVAYRLAPENRYPAAINDAYAATVWVAGHASEIGGDPSRVAVGGDGAGGNLAAVVALMDRDRKGPRLVGQVLLYPALDATMLSSSRILSHDPVFTSDAMLATNGAYIPVNSDLQDPYISPVYAASMANLPRAYILTGVDDPVNDEADRYANELKSAGVPVQVSRYPNAMHGFFMMASSLNSGKKCIEEVAAILKQAFSTAKGA